MLANRPWSRRTTPRSSVPTSDFWPERAGPAFHPAVSQIALTVSRISLPPPIPASSGAPSRISSSTADLTRDQTMTLGPLVLSMDCGVQVHAYLRNL